MSRNTFIVLSLSDRDFWFGHSDNLSVGDNSILMRSSISCCSRGDWWVVIYTACTSLAKWWGLFLGTFHFDLEGADVSPR